MVLDALDEMIVRMADEGIPIGAISRIAQVPTEDFRPVLRGAVTDGRLLEMPREDWPPIVPRIDRTPQVSDARMSQARAKQTISDDDTILLSIAEVFKTTRLQGKVLLKLVRRGHCTKEMLHDTVEDNRGNPSEPTQGKIVQVMICHLRKKLLPFGWKIKTHHGSGYSMAVETRQQIITLLTGSVGCPGEQLSTGLDI